MLLDFLYCIQGQHFSVQGNYYWHLQQNILKAQISNNYGTESQDKRGVWKKDELEA